MAIKAGDKVTISAKWLNVCGKQRATGATWTVVLVQPMVGGECMYHLVSAKHGIWSVWSIRGVTLVLDAKAKRARKAARKLVQRPWNGKAVAANDAARLLNANAKRRQSHNAYATMFPGAKPGITMVRIMYRDFSDARILRREASRL